MMTCIYKNQIMSKDGVTAPFGDRLMFAAMVLINITET